MERITEQHPGSFSIFNADTKNESTKGKTELYNRRRARTQSFRGVF